MGGAETRAAAFYVSSRRRDLTIAPRDGGTNGRGAGRCCLDRERRQLCLPFTSEWSVSVDSRVVGNGFSAGGCIPVLRQHPQTARRGGVAGWSHALRTRPSCRPLRVWAPNRGSVY